MISFYMPTFRVKAAAVFITVAAFFTCLYSWAGSFQGRIVKVSDGDTVWVKVENSGRKIKIRVLGIDTPEKFRSKKLTHQAITCSVPEKRIVYLGKLASKHAKEILDHLPVRIETFGHGRYGRVLGFIFVGKENFSYRMVEDGYACVYRTKRGKSRELPLLDWMMLLRLERTARQEKRGLWGVDYELMNCLCR